VEGEADVCPDITITGPEHGPRDHDYVCMVSSRAWAAVMRDSTVRNLAKRDANGRPSSAEVSFWRDPNANDPPLPTVVYWIVTFQAVDDINISVAVDSTSGRTLVHRDTEWSRLK
jgi:hypothetical protein